MCSDDICYAVILQKWVQLQLKKSKKLSVSNDKNFYCISEFKYQREKL